MDIFVKGFNILISTFCVCADGFKAFQKLFTIPYTCTIINFLFASLKLLTNVKKCLLKPSSEFPSL